MFCIQKSRMAHRDSWLKISKDWNGVLATLSSHLELEVIFQTHSDCWQNPFPVVIELSDCSLLVVKWGRSWVPREHLYSFSWGPFHLQTSKLSPACYSNLSEFLSTTNLFILRSHVIRATQLFPCIKVDCAR